MFRLAKERGRGWRSCGDAKDGEKKGLDVEGFGSA